MEMVVYCLRILGEIILRNERKGQGQGREAGGQGSVVTSSEFFRELGPRVQIQGKGCRV